MSLALPPTTNVSSSSPAILPTVAVPTTVTGLLSPPTTAIPTATILPPPSSAPVAREVVEELFGTKALETYFQKEGMPEYANSIATTFPNTKVVTQSPEKAYQTFVDIYNTPPPPAFTSKDMDILANTDDLTYDVSMLWATEHCFMHVRHAKQLELLASMKPLLDDDESFALLASAAVTMQRFEHNLRSFDDAAAKAEMQVLLQHPVMDAMGTYLLNQTPKKIEKFVEKIKTVGGIEEVLQAGATDCGQFRNPNECNTDSYCEWKQNKCRARREPYTDTKKRFIFRSIMLAGILLFALFTYILFSS